MLKAAAALCLLILAFPALGAHQMLICEDCRDVRDHPQDFGNYAFNRLIEPMPNDQFSIYSTYSTSSYVWNTEDQWALVHLEDIIEQTGAIVSLGFITIPVELSSDFLKIRVTTMYGNSIVYEILETSRPLVVGDRDTAPPAPPPKQKAGAHGGGQEILCCQSGAYYWYYDQPAFNIQFGNE